MIALDKTYLLKKQRNGTTGDNLKITQRSKDDRR